MYVTWEVHDKSETGLYYLKLGLVLNLFTEFLFLARTVIYPEYTEEQCAQNC